MDNKELLNELKKVQELADGMGKIDDYADLIVETSENDIYINRDDLVTFIRISAENIKRLNMSPSIWVAMRTLINTLEKEVDSDKTPEQELAELEEGATDDLPFC